MNALPGVTVPNASGAVAVCGKCNVPMELHPVEQCPYEYAVVKNAEGKAIGYFMLGKKTKKEEPTNGLREVREAPA